MSVLIKNGLIYNGKGQPPFKGSVLIRGERIISVGIKEFNHHKAGEVIDAEGAIVTPGFIDINSLSDRRMELLENPFQEENIKRGITTIIGGNGGVSLAPLINGFPQKARELRLEQSFSININWQSFGEFLKTLERRGLGVNFGSLVGYNTIRKDIVDKKSPNKKEIDFIKKELKTCLKEGALGISVNFEDLQLENISIREALEVAKILEEPKKEPKKVYAVIVRDPLKIEESIIEIADISEKTDINLEINALQPLKNTAKAYQKIQKILEEKSNKRRINFDCYPHEALIIPAYKIMPAEMQNLETEKIRQIVQSEKHNKKLLNHLKSITAKKIVIADTPLYLNFLKGRALKDIAKEWGLTQPETLLKLLKISSLKMTLFYHNVDWNTLSSLMLSDISFIASYGVHLIEKEINPFANFIHWVSKNSKMPLEKALAKFTYLPALKYGIKERGAIVENYFADIVVIKNQKIKDVVINGKIVLKNEKLNKILNGRIIRN